jgi:thiol-disulfide isomerase/thioredoxin
MANNGIQLATALILAGAFARLAPAQVTMAPESPRWGETITITADPPVGVNETQRFYKSDQLYAVLQLYHQALGSPRDALTVPMAWDGRRFVGRVALPEGCEAGLVTLATPERYFDTARARFVCRKSDGSLPPGSVIAGLFVGAGNKSNWKSDVAQDLEALRKVKGHGWEYAQLWLFSWSEEKTPPDERLRQLEQVEREEGENPGPALLSSLVFGYFRASQPRKGFDRLNQLCDRFPQSQYTAGLGLYFATAAVVNNPEFEGELNELLARVAKAAPENKGLRELFTRLATKAPNVPLKVLRTVAERWIADQPASMEPHYILATALARVPNLAAEAEAELSQAINLSLQPHPFRFTERAPRQRAFRLRSELRARRGDLLGAIADARMAQLVAEDKAGADDLSAEAALWQRLGYSQKAESLALEAYRRGSLKAEAVLKEAYIARTGGDATGFRDYLIDALRKAELAGGSSFKALPSFSATTLAGVKVDPTSLSGKITVVDFWFIGCPPCRAERPKLNEIVDEFGDRVRFLSFALDKPDALKAYLNSNPFKYEIVPESEQLARLFGVQSFPSHMIIDRNGHIVWVAGADDDRIERLRATIFRLLALSGNQTSPGKGSD